jgi:hypothetical protein
MLALDPHACSGLSKQTCSHLQWGSGWGRCPQTPAPAAGCRIRLGTAATLCLGGSWLGGAAPNPPRLQQAVEIPERRRSQNSTQPCTGTPVAPRNLDSTVCRQEAPATHPRVAAGRTQLPGLKEHERTCLRQETDQRSTGSSSASTLDHASRTRMKTLTAGFELTKMGATPTLVSVAALKQASEDKAPMRCHRTRSPSARVTQPGSILSDGRK